MTRTESSDPLARIHKRIDFARRLTSHRVRTGTIMQLTDLSLNRLTALRRTWGVPQDTRLRGQGPKSLDRFLNSPEARTDTAAVLSICQIFDALPKRPRDFAPDGNLFLESGMKLLSAFEAYHAYRPGSDLEFDELMLLIGAIDKGDVLRLGTCKTCRALIVIAKFDPSKPICSHCQLRPH